jgi:hypothetical protein
VYSISDIEKLPEPLKREVLHYAELLARRYLGSRKGPHNGKWLPVVERGMSIGEKASVTVIKNRENEKW